MRLQRNSKTPRFIIWVVILQSDGFQSLYGASLDEDFAGALGDAGLMYLTWCWWSKSSIVGQLGLYTCNPKP